MEFRHAVKTASPDAGAAAAALDEWASIRGLRGSRPIAVERTSTRDGKPLFLFVGTYEPGPDFKGCTICGFPIVRGRCAGCEVTHV